MAVNPDQKRATRRFAGGARGMDGANPIPNQKPERTAPMNRFPNFRLALPVALGLAVPAAAQSTWYVAADADPAIATGSQSEPFRSIQLAIDVAAPGDTIRLAAGVYDQSNISLQKGLTIAGAGMGQTVIDTGFMGRAIEVGGATVGFTIRDLEIRGCRDSGGAFGGGMSIRGETDGALEHVRFADNEADGAAAGLVVRGGSSTPTQLTIDGCEFIHNRSVAGGGRGAAISVMFNAANVVVRNCLFDGNSASAGFAAMFYTQNDQNVEIVNCTVVNHPATANAYDSLIYIGFGTASISNCVFADNLAIGLSHSTSSTATIDHSALATGMTTNFTDAGGNLEGAVEFVDAPNGDYRLRNGALGFDAGDAANAAMNGITEDIAGNPRVRFATIDMGAYETELGGFDTIIAGCAGSNAIVPQLQPVGGMPSVAGTAFELADLQPMAFAWVALGFTSAGPNGLDLGSYGAPGCFLLPDQPLLAPVATDASGIGQTAVLGFGNDPMFAGVPILVQGLALDIGANQLGFAFSDGCRAVLGY
ncbi:MAG: right-handed parallel beta-helix repeat-containing protein [Planctomycetes bacterium]|nr:right-handed parallel beta-helix repeat-containing protein [Planctomycetota bacterium]